MNRRSKGGQKRKLSTSAPKAFGATEDGKLAATAAPKRGSTWPWGLLLVVMTVIAYWPALHGGFIWDDDTHISADSTLRSPHALREIWFQPGATAQYYPLTFTAFWIGFRLWGLNTLGFHLLTLFFHCAASLLLWRFLTRLRVRGAWLAGALFALHPVCVMSAAWMTELKNTLSATLALAAGLAYLRFARLGKYGEGERRDPPPRPEWGYYILALALFQLALFAKTAVSFLPVSLLLVVWWQRPRLTWRDVWPLTPLLGIAALMGVITIYVEHHSGGASGETFKLGAVERVLVSGRSFWFYLGKLFFPRQLTFIYPRWQVDTRVWWQWLYPVATFLFLGALWALRRRVGKGLFAALLHFYVSTSFLILLVVLFMTRYSFVSDHWQYFGCMGVIAAAAAGITWTLNRLSRRRAFLKPLLGGALLLALGALTWRQCGMYRDLETLWWTTLARNPDCWMAHNNLGLELSSQGKWDEARQHYERALELKPDYAEAHNNFGNALSNEGKWAEAIEHYEQALEARPSFADAHNNLGVALARQGKWAEARQQYQQALQFEPDFADAHNNFGYALAAQGKLEEGIQHFERALQLKPDFADAHINFGVTLAAQGKWEEASQHYEQALQSKPDSAEAEGNLGNAFAAQGKREEARQHLQQALNLATAQNNPALADALRAGLKRLQPAPTQPQTP